MEIKTRSDFIPTEPKFVNPAEPVSKAEIGNSLSKQKSSFGQTNETTGKQELRKPAQIVDRVIIGKK